MADRGTVEAASIPPSAAADPHGLPESRPQLGSLLLRDGVITAEQLQAALAQKEAEGGRLGEILLRYNIATGAGDRARPRGAVRPRVRGAEPVRGRTRRNEPVAREVARRLSALPIGFDEDETVIVAVTDPTDVMASDDLRLALGLQDPLRRRPSPTWRAPTAASAPTCRSRWSRTCPEEEEHELPRGHHRGRRGRRTGDQADEPDHRNVIADSASDIHFELQPQGMVVRARIDGVDAQGRRGPDRPHARCHEPPEDHGRARHRRLPHRTGTGVSRSAMTAT